jgi:hypothetical protein
LIALALAVLVILARADLKGLALGTGTAMVRLALRMQAAGALWACVFRLIALPMSRTVASLMAIIGLAVTGRTPGAATIRRWAAGAAMAVGMWRFHRWRV